VVAHSELCPTQTPCVTAADDYNDLLCVGWEVKPCTLTHSLTMLQLFLLSTVYTVSQKSSHL